MSSVEFKKASWSAFHGIKTGNAEYNFGSDLPVFNVKNLPFDAEDLSCSRKVESYAIGIGDGNPTTFNPSMTFVDRFKERGKRPPERRFSALPEALAGCL